MNDRQTRSAAAALPLTLFADFTCPFCYVTEAALRRRAAGGGVAVSYRAYEVYPAPTPAAPPDAEAGWDAHVQPLAEALGLTLRAPHFRPRTRKAHEAARFAASRGAGEAVREAVYRAYWAEGADIGRIDVLQGLAERCGLDPVDLKIALDIDQHRDQVLGDQALARRLRVPGVPVLFVGTGPSARVLVGAQSLPALDDAIRGG